MALLKFKVNSNSDDGKTPVYLMLDKSDIYDNDLKIVDVYADRGMVTIINEK